MPTVREKEGLALSSRNSYLSARERLDALVLSRSLDLAGDLIRKGRRDCREIIRRMKGLINSRKNSRIDYVAIVDPDTLKPLDKIQDKCLVALAARIGKTRLIDNIIVKKREKLEKRGRMKRGRMKWGRFPCFISAHS